MSGDSFPGSVRCWLAAAGVATLTAVFGYLAWLEETGAGPARPAAGGTSGRDSGSTSGADGAQRRSSDTALQPASHEPAAPVRASRFLNTSPEATYVGASACAACHPDEHASYQDTAHSLALDEIDLSAEPADGQFEHEPSGRSYRVYREDGQFRHRESLPLGADGGDADELVLADYPIKYVIGSGHHSRSYLVEVDDYLVESPITWYASRQAWDMSPGYDRPHHASFERVADLGCLYCHVGRVRARDTNRNRVALLENAVGCERCHGPGSLHAAHHEQQGAAAGEQGDLTIVHPARLTRAESEAVCAQCHLRGDAAVAVRGRAPTDFRPGQQLTDFRVDYQREAPDHSMKVVGHIAQMHLSRCYQETATLTCTTCHNPHATPDPQERAAYFRAKCLECHAEEHCGLPRQQRLRRDAADNCVACHMPQSETDIPHIAFTHHRIAVHETPSGGPAARARELVRLQPVDDVSHLPAGDRARCLGLAYMEFSEHQREDDVYLQCRQLARQHLLQAARAGVRDPDVLSALAGLAWEENDFARAVQLANETLRQPRSLSAAHENALAVLGDSLLRMGQLGGAEAALSRLVQQRRSSEDWLRLGLCRKQAGDPQKSLEALQQAARINGTRPQIYALLADAYRSLGNDPMERKCRRRAELLSARRLPAAASAPVRNTQPTAASSSGP